MKESTGQPKKVYNGVLASAMQLDRQITGDKECCAAPRILQGLLARGSVAGQTDYW